MIRFYTETFKSLPLAKQRVIIVCALPASFIIGFFSLLVGKFLFNYMLFTSVWGLVFEGVFQGLIIYTLGISLWLWIQDGKMQDKLRDQK